VKTDGSTRAYRITNTLDEAIQIGRRIAMNNGYELIVHRQKQTSPAGAGEVRAGLRPDFST